MTARVPEDAPPGPLTVFVGDGNAATAYDLSLYPPDPHSLDQVLDFLARVRPPEHAQPAGLPLARPAPWSTASRWRRCRRRRAALLRDRGPGDGTPDLGYLRLQVGVGRAAGPGRGLRAPQSRSASEDLVTRPRSRAWRYSAARACAFVAGRRGRGLR